MVLTSGFCNRAPLLQSERNLYVVRPFGTSWYKTEFVMEFALRFIATAVIIMLLISAISLPLHVYFRKLSLRSTIADPRFWASTLSVSIVVALLVSLGGS